MLTVCRPETIGQNELTLQKSTFTQEPKMKIHAYVKDFYTSFASFLFY